MIRADFHDIKEKIKGAFHHHHHHIEDKEEYDIQEVVMSGAVKVDVEIQWTETESKRRYKECASHVKKEEYSIHEEIKETESKCLADKWD